MRLDLHCVLPDGVSLPPYAHVMFRWKRPSDGGVACGQAFINYCATRGRAATDTVLHLQNLASRTTEGQDVMTHTGRENVLAFFAGLYNILGAKRPYLISLDDLHDRVPYTVWETTLELAWKAAALIVPRLYLGIELRRRYGRKLERTVTGEYWPRCAYGHDAWPVGYGSRWAPVLWGSSSDLIRTQILDECRRQCDRMGRSHSNIVPWLEAPGLIRAASRGGDKITSEQWREIKDKLMSYGINDALVYCGHPPHPNVEWDAM